MGNWVLNILGIGPHHNTDNPGDADVILKKTVEDLQANGHTVTHASITHGAREEIATTTDEAHEEKAKESESA